jgi:DNA-binding CsgD family transcriptional regulator
MSRAKSKGLFLPSEQRLIDIIIKHNETSREDMAQRLGISIHTIKTLLVRIYAKLSVNSLAQLKAHYNVERTKTCTRCCRHLPISAFKKADRKWCMQCMEHAQESTIARRMHDYLTANGPTVAAKMADAFGTTSKVVGTALSIRPDLFCMVGKEHNPHGPDRPTWGIVGTEPQPEPETPSIITWQHKSPVAEWTLSGQVVQKKGRHFIVEAYGHRYEVPETSLV